jgi:uroporphyrinogen-III decarboxylase
VAGWEENEGNNQDVAGPVDIFKMITSKRLVRGAFEAAELPRLPFIPWIFTHAARLEQAPVRRTYFNPTQYTKCLQNAQKLYGYDGIASGFDSSLEMEICGRPVNWGGDYEAPTVSPNPGFDLGRLKDIDVESAAKTGRFATVIESLRRINKVSGSNLALAAVVTGPLTLTAGLTGRDPLKELAERPEEAMGAIQYAAGFLLKVVQIYCQLELDIIAVTERLLPAFPPAHLSWLRSTFLPVVNMVRFYNAFSVLLPGESSPDNIANLLNLGFDGIVAAGIDIDTWNKLRAGRSCILGKAVPVRLLNSGMKELQLYLDTDLFKKNEPGVFLTTDWEVPPETPPDNIHLVMNMISRQSSP